MLSKRQKTLFDRLVMLGRWAEDGRLPVDVAEIIGFGSFFRGKPNPKDVDLLIQRSGETTPRFQLFLKRLDVAKGDEYQERFDKPLDAFLEIYDRSLEGQFPGFLDLSEDRKIYETWLEQYSWRMLFGTTLAEQATCNDPEGFTKRLIKRHFPSINVPFYLRADQQPNDLGLVTSYTVLIWSRDKRDVRSNLELALSPESIRNAIESEIDNFDRQLFRLRGNVELVTELIKLLKRAVRSRVPSDHSWTWLRSWFDNLSPKPLSIDSYQVLIEKKQLLLNSELLLERGKEYASPMYLESDNLAKIVEAKRKEVKSLHDYMDALVDVFHSLAWYKAYRVETPLRENQFVVAEVSQRKKPGPAVIHQILDDFGFVSGAK
jgi:hypothetical protein